MTPQEFTKALEHIEIDVKRFAAEGAPLIAGKTAADFFADSFHKQGFTNRSFKPWKEVLRRQVAAKTERQKTLAGRPILTGKTADLGKSIYYDTARGQATVYSDVSYAEYHNQGTKTIAKRQFIGDSVQLDKRVMSELERKLNKVFGIK